MSLHFNKLKGTTLGLDDQLGFGRHIGYTVLEVVKDRPEYIKWLIDNTGIKFYPSVLEELLRQMTPEALFTNYNIAYHRGHKYIANYDHDTCNEWSDWDADVPF